MSLDTNLWAVYVFLGRRRYCDVQFWLHTLRYDISRVYVEPNLSSSLNGCSTTRAKSTPRGGRRCFGPQSAVPAPPLTGERQRTPILPTTAACSLSNPNSRLVIHTQWQPLQFDIGSIYQPFKKVSNLTPWMGSLYVSYRTLADLLLNPSGM